MDFKVAGFYSKKNDPAWDVDAETRGKSDKEQAGILGTMANDYRNVGYLEKAAKLYRAAIEKAVKAKDTKKEAELRKELGRLYYYYTANSAKAYCTFGATMGSRGASGADGELSVPDLQDMQRFMYSQLRIEKILTDEKMTDPEDGTVKNSQKDEWNYSASFDFNRLFPQAFSSVGSLKAAFTYRNVNFDGSKNIRSVFVTQDKIDSDPLMPLWMKEKLGVTYPTLDLNGARSFQIDLNYGVSTFNSFFTAPYPIYAIFPKVNLGYSVNYTALDATAYGKASQGDADNPLPHRDFTAEESVQDFVGLAGRRDIWTVKHNFSYGLDLMSFIINPKDYKFSWYITPLAGGSVSLYDRRYKDVYSFLSCDFAKPGMVSADSWWAGIRVNSQRFPGRDDASRINLNVRIQSDKAINSDADSGIFVDNTKVFKSSHVTSLMAGIDWDLDILVGDDKGVRDEAVDKYPFKLTIPFSVQGGWSDIAGVTGKKLADGTFVPKDKIAGYLAFTTGVRYKSLEALYTYSISQDGISYGSSAHTISFGWRF